MLGGTMAIDWGPSREVLWWFETDYVGRDTRFYSIKSEEMVI